MALDDADAGCCGAGVAPAGLRHARNPSREAELFAGGIIVLAGAFIYPYLESLVGPIMPGCLFHRVTGLPCLLCGMTRSLAATARGDLAEAFRMHLLGPPFFLLITVVTLLLAVEFVVSRRILPRPGRRAWKYTAWGTLGVLAVVWVIRLVFLGVNV
jgi:hypothetical protein